MKPRHLAIKILKRIDETEAYSDIVIDHELQRSKLSNRDKSFVNELVNGTTRWRGQLDWLIEHFYQGKLNKCPSYVKYILEITFYQIIYLDKIPNYAAINEATSLTKKISGDYWAKKVNGIVRTFIRERNQLIYSDINTDPVEHIAIKYSHPQWIIQRWIDRYGIEETQKLCLVNNRTPKISLRVNQTKTSIEQLKKILIDNRIETQSSAYLPEFLSAKTLPDLKHFKPFQQGFFSIQDESAGLVAYLIDPKPGEIIIDLCAAPGGKTTHLVERSNNRCQIISIDKYHNRLSLVRQNVKRLNLSNIYLINADATQFSGITGDKVLVDAPCSGFGVLSKRADLRWKKTPEQIATIIQLQKQILNKAASLVKKGGILVYSTCTIEPDENENMISNFLNDKPNFVIDDPSKFVNANLVSEDKYVYTYPHIHHMDGSFAVRLVKR